jgi:hypothetical protein
VHAAQQQNERPGDMRRAFSSRETAQYALRPTNPLNIVIATILMSNQNDQLWM